MKQNNHKREDETRTKKTCNTRKGRGHKPGYKKDVNRTEEKYNGDSAKLNAEGRQNNPNYYFLDKGVADQVSQLSFQQLGGTDINFKDNPIGYPTIKAHFWNPSAGVVRNNNEIMQSGINMAGLRLFSKISAYTGRTAIYGPQDLSTMLLAMGEIISCMGWLRRTFGLSMLGSEYNRTYPRQLLQAIKVDDIDFYPRYAEYRNRFNKLVTLINQIPIPQNVAYFDKCAHLYEKFYVDQNSPLATAIIDNPATTWILDEISYSGGSVLKTTSWCVDAVSGNSVTPQPLDTYLNEMENLITTLLQSSTLQVIYTDLLNLATKQQVPFWKFDYLQDGYLVLPDYNMNYLLQMHNATIPGIPFQVTTLHNLFTPLNDVYPDPNNNALIYNPSFPTINSSSGVREPRTFGSTIVDMTNPSPTVEDRIEVIRWISMCNNANTHDLDGDGTITAYDYVLPDHYLAKAEYFDCGTIKFTKNGSKDNGPVSFSHLAAYTSKVDWDTMYYLVDDVDCKFTGYMIGELNYYTKISYEWLRPIFNFTSLALYDVR